MKAAILLMVAMMGMNAHAIEFKSPGPDPAVLVFNSNSPDDGYYLKAFNTGSKTELRLYDNVYSLYVSSGALVSVVSITPEERSRLSAVILATSKNCPLKITFNRATGVILKVESACDPLARLDVQDNEG